MLGFPLDSRITYVTDPDTGVITPKYDRAVTSKPLREYIRGIVTTGVLPNPSDNLQVFPGTDGMTVIVHAGFAVIDGGLAKEDNNRTLEVTVSDATYDRIDTVVVRWNDNDSVRNVDLYIKQGVPARNPVRPTLAREGSVYEIGLADIFVTKNVRTITAEKITDTRLESSRCGVASSIAKWDTTTIYQQIQSDLAGFKSNEQAEFMTWFNAMKDQLTTDAAGRLQTEVDDINEQIDNITNGTCANLLNPAAQTRTIKGITFTNNGDGTYTVNGTATAPATLVLYSINDTDFSIFQNKKIVGCPIGGSRATYILTLGCYNGNTRLKEFDDFGNGNVISNIPLNTTNVSVVIVIRKGQTLNNLIFKPMLTTDLNATYDDFVPYTGNSGRLNEDVANLFDVIRPVGSLYSTTNATFDPNTAKGWHGTWERIKNCVIYAAGDSDTVGQIVGSNTHTLTTAELPSHTHSIPALSGSTDTTGSHTHDTVNQNLLSNDTEGSTLQYPSSGSGRISYAGRKTKPAGSHNHSVTTEASTTGSQGSGTAIDIRPRRLNSVVWRRTA